MEHALRYHVRKHLDEDPEHYRKLSERLEGILEELTGQWDALAEALKDLVREARAGRQVDETGLDPATEAPFLALLRREVAGDEALEGEALARLCAVTVELVDHIRQELRLVDFWCNTGAQIVLRHWIVQFLDEHDVIKPFERLAAVADRLVELAKANHHRLVR
jgi:type I restriction enzyme R subunit